jgi:hypothetical protein
MVFSGTKPSELAMDVLLKYIDNRGHVYPFVAAESRLV